MTKTQAFRLIGGPCHGAIAELPVDDFDEVWRCVPGLNHYYARYERDGAVFRFAQQTLSAEELASHVRDLDAKAVLHVDSRKYER